jgi:hypothetical protein
MMTKGIRRFIKSATHSLLSHEIRQAAPGKYYPLVSPDEAGYNNSMKIEGPSKSGGVKGASKTGAKKGADGIDFGGLLGGAEETSSAAPTSNVMSIQGIDALLSLQEAGDGTQGGSKKAKVRAEVLLDELDKLRMGLLNGGIPVATLQHLKSALNSQRGEVMDPQLTELLDEIDLRVQVELAKHEQS